MTEPTTSTAAAVGLGALAASTMHELAPFVPVVVGAAIGVLHPLSKQDFDASHLKAFAYAFRWLATAVVLTGFVSYLLETYLHFPASKWPSVVAFLIAFLADKWPLWTDKLGESLTNKFAKKIEGGS